MLGNAILNFPGLSMRAYQLSFFETQVELENLETLPNSSVKYAKFT